MHKGFTLEQLVKNKKILKKFKKDRAEVGNNKKSGGKKWKTMH